MREQLITFYMNRAISLNRAVLIAFIMILLWGRVTQVNAATYYVAPDSSAENLGTQEAPWSLDKANTNLAPGDTVVLMDGTYSGTPIAPDQSGENGKHIVYRATNPLGAFFQNINEVEGSNGPAAIFVQSKSYITVDGIKVVGVKRWIVATESHHITIANCHFEDGSGWDNGRFRDIGDGIHIKNNYFHNGSDLLCLNGGSGHLVEGNYFGDASHTGLVFLQVQRSVVRNNYLTNRMWRCMEVESQRTKEPPFRLSEYNLIENNVFDYTPCSSIQYAGNRSILRRNIFRRGLRGMSFSNYMGSADNAEAWYDESNRFYNNVITECGSNDIVFQIIADNSAEGIDVAEKIKDDGYSMVYSTNLFNPTKPDYPYCAYGDNIMVNNIFYLNTNTKDSRSSNTMQIAFMANAVPEFGRYHNNNIYSGAADSKVFFIERYTTKTRNKSIVNFQSQFPEWATNNIEVDPQFVDPDQADYHLNQGSLCINAGGSLTKTKSAGQGTIVDVEDVLYFCDGHGLVGPDTIRVGSERVIIDSVNYDDNTLTIDRAISWQEGAPVTLDYQGSAPDIGAYEYPESQTGISRSQFPESFCLYQNYPNPFNPKTCIRYDLVKSSHVTLDICNIMGQKIRTLINENQEAGTHQVVWNGKDESGTALSSGIYFYQLKHNEQRIIKKMMLLK